MSCYIKDLQEEIKQLKKSLQNIHNKLYCIGGPLNDNVLQFNNKQMSWCRDIAVRIRMILGDKK